MSAFNVRLAFALVATGLFSAAPAQTLAPIKIIEASIETTTLAISLPASAPARFVARSCPTCEAVTLAITEESRFLMGREEIPYAQFLATGRSGSHFMTIHYTPETLDVTRIVIHVTP